MILFFLIDHYRNNKLLFASQCIKQQYENDNSNQVYNIYSATQTHISVLLHRILNTYLQ